MCSLLLMYIVAHKSRPKQIPNYQKNRVKSY